MSTHPRLAPVLDAMAQHDVDVLLLGRPGNARFVSGADTLALAGTRPWGPGCVVVRATGAVHLLATSDAGIPAEIPRQRLFPVSWNPSNLLGSLAAIDGMRDARRVGVDGITPLLEQLLPVAVPGAQLVDGEALLRPLRVRKAPEEVMAIAAAAAVARDAFAVLRAAVQPGVAVAALAAAFLERMCTHRVTTPAFDPRVRAGGRLLDGADVLPAGLVHVEAGVVRDGWEASLGRTLAAGDGDDGARERIAAWSRRRDEIVATLGSRATVGDLRAEPGVAVEGVGLGYERLDDSDPLEPGVVLGLVLEASGARGRDVVALGVSGPAILTA
jgi:Xaa-Pro dipeptidase